MKLEDFNLTYGENNSQKAFIERNDKTIDYDAEKELSYSDIINLSKGLEVISEFFDVNSAVSVSCGKISSLSLGKIASEAVINVVDSNPIEFLSSAVVVSSEVDSDIAKLLKEDNIVAAPEFTNNAVEILRQHNVNFIKILTPLKEYKKYLSNSVITTPLGTLIQEPNLTELSKETFKVVSKTKPTVEQIEDAVFAWKVAKHCFSKAVVIAKDLKTTAISQGLHASAVEFALDYSCDMSKEAILAADISLTVHDIEVAAQGRISLIILPFANSDLIKTADKYNIAVITTGFTNTLIR